jgi:hypothetical protein
MVFISLAFIGALSLGAFADVEPMQSIVGEVVSVTSRWVHDGYLVTDVTVRFPGRSETRTVVGGEMEFAGVGTVRQYALSAPIYRVGQLVDGNLNLLEQGQGEFSVGGAAWPASEFPVKVYPSKKLFPGVSKPDLLAAAVEVAGEWNAVENTSFQFAEPKLGNKKLNPNDRKNRIVSVKGVLGANQVTDRIMTEVNGEITDVDVLINGDKSYVIDVNRSPGSVVYDVRTVLRQAFGLIAGLGFSNVQQAVMHAPVPANTERFIINDDMRGMRQLYPEVVLGSISINVAGITPTQNPLVRGRLLNVPVIWSSVVEGQMVVGCGLVDAATGAETVTEGTGAYVFGPAENQLATCQVTIPRTSSTTATSRVTAYLFPLHASAIATTSAPYHKDWTSP